MTDIPIRFQVLEEIGKGASGTVYLAVDKNNNQEVALKKLSFLEVNTDGSKAILEKEYSILHSLEHSGIVRVHDFLPKHRLLVMQYIKGISLSQTIGRMTLQDNMEILREISSALEYVHSRNVLHRDLKPSNILIASDGQNPVLIDFGSAVYKPQSDYELQKRIQIEGSPAYMAPEYITRGIASVQSDIYSFGVLAFELLLGRRPFAGKNIQHIGAAHLFQKDYQTELLALGVNKQIQQSLLICLEKDPLNRFSSFSEIRELFTDQTTKQQNEHRGLLKRVLRKFSSSEPR